jgi:hypothetical protein
LADEAEKHAFDAGVGDRREAYLAMAAQWRMLAADVAPRRRNSLKRSGSALRLGDGLARFFEARLRARPGLELLCHQPIVLCHELKPMARFSFAHGHRHEADLLGPLAVVLKAFGVCHVAP